MKILIADDDVTSRLVLMGVLRKHGHDVVVTVDGAQALEAMHQADAPKLAILDWMMPGLTGVEVCRQVRSIGSDQPPYLIILTSRGSKADVVAGLEAGADDYLAKPFDPEELRARVEVARRMVELQARLVEARDALTQQAMHDPLTGVLNRRAFSEVLSREIARERRRHDGLAIAICDIDRFKQINDTHGHQVGDDVVCGLVQRLQGNLRANDVLGRHGGDEFVVLAPSAGADGARQVFERVRAAVAAGPVPTRVGDLSITVSIGVKTWTPGASEEATLEEADAALYRAKSSGRNRVCVATEAGDDAPGGGERGSPPTHVSVPRAQ